MKRLVVCLLLVVVCGSANAADINLILSKGKYYHVTADPVTGVPVQTPVNVVIMNLDGSVPFPNPVPTPTPTVGLEASAARLTKESLNAGGTPTTAAGISGAYGMISDLVGKGEVKPEQALPGVNFLLDGLLATQPDKDKWVTFRTGLGKDFDTLRQDGVLKTKEQYSKAFSDVAKGINGVISFNGSMTAPAQQLSADAGILDKIDIAKLIELFKFLMELWKLFSPAVTYLLPVVGAFV